MEPNNNAEDLAIHELEEALSVTSDDMIPMEQTGLPKYVKMSTLIAKLAQLLDGHGGINAITKTGHAGLVDTYIITMADNTSSEITVTNGEKGDAPALIGTSVQYAKSNSGTIAPESGWASVPPAVPGGGYLWTKIILTFDTGTSEICTTTRYGIDSTPSPEMLKDGAMEHRTFLLIGDSYAMPEADGTNWPAAFSAAVGADHWHGVPFPGHGFSSILGDNTFASALESYLDSQKSFDPNDITDIIIAGGRNDADDIAAAAGIRDGFEAFVALCAQELPNANVRVAFVGADTNLTELTPYRYPLLRAALREYSRLPGYMAGSENILFDSAWMQADGKHPNLDGKRYLGRQLANIWISGSCTNVGDAATTTLIPVGINGTLSIVESYRDGIVTLSVKKTAITFGTDIQTNPDCFHKIGRILPKYLRPDTSDVCQIPVMVTCFVNQKYKNVPGVIRIASDAPYSTGATVYLSIAAINDDGSNWDVLETPTVTIWPTNPVTFPQFVTQ